MMTSIRDKIAYFTLCDIAKEENIYVYDGFISIFTSVLLYLLFFKIFVSSFLSVIFNIAYPFII